MIIVENLGNVERRYSDNFVKLRKIEDGTIWDDAIDIIPCQFTYEETDIPVETDGEDADTSDYEEALSELGVKI